MQLGTYLPKSIKKMHLKLKMSKEICEIKIRQFQFSKLYETNL